MLSVRLRDHTKTAKHAPPAPHASRTRVAVGCSAAPDAVVAAEEAWWQVCQGLGGAAPELALLFCASDIDGAAVATALQRASEAKGGTTTLVGQTSQGGVLSKRGGARLGLVGLQHAAWLLAVGEYPIIGAEHAEAAGAAAATALLADAKRQSAGRVTSPPDLLLLMSAPVGEEAVLRGVQRILGDVTVFGGSSADESVLNNTEPGGWWQVCGIASAEAWRVSKDSVVMVGLYLRHPDACQCSIGSVYVPTKKMGVATAASGRVIRTIGGKPAVEVLDGWCGGALKRQQSAGGGVVRAAALFPLDVRASKKQTRPRLVHMKRILPDNAIECFGPIGQGQELRLNSRKVADIPV